MTATVRDLLLSVGVIANSFAIWRLGEAVREVTRTLRVHLDWLELLSDDQHRYVSPPVAPDESWQASEQDRSDCGAEWNPKNN